MKKFYFDPILELDIDLIEPIVEKPYPNEHACRLRDPGDFRQDTYARTSREHDGKRYDVIMAKLKPAKVPEGHDPDSMVEQAYRYPKDIWDEGPARVHCTAHNGIDFEPAKSESRQSSELDRQFHAQIKHKSMSGDNLVIEGWASTAAIDREDEVIEPTAFEDALKAPYPKILLDHWAMVRNLAGKIISMTVKPVEGFWIKAMLSKANDVADAVTKVKEGILDAFSVGFRPISFNMVDGIKHWTALELYEVSLVAIPCNRECVFSVAKGLKYGTDIMVPYSEIVKDIETLKIKVGATESLRLKNIEPGAAPGMTEDRYAATLLELRRINCLIVQERDAEAIKRLNNLNEKILKGG
jgi:HK97 family phage prohead protease